MSSFSVANAVEKLEISSGQRWFTPTPYKNWPLCLCKVLGKRLLRYV